MFLLTKR